MESAYVKEFVFKRNMTVSNFAKDLQISTSKGEVVSADPQLLFQRLVAISSANKNVDLGTLFEYELSPYPPALFDTSSLMRSANKPKLAEALSKFQLVEVEAPQEGVKYVLDGGALLQRIPWEIKRTYKQISEAYVGFIKKNFGRNVVIVFDSYPDQPSTKDQTHMKRAKTFCPVIDFNEDMVLDIKKERFLSNKKNKQKFLNLLKRKLLEQGYDVHSAEDADLLIVLTAVELAENLSTVLIGHNTDPLVLLCHYAKLNANKLYLKTKNKTWDILDLKSNMGSTLCSNILFIHSFLGCDTTSQIFGIAKDRLVKKMSKRALSSAKVFYNENAAKQDIVDAGQTILLELYNRRAVDCLDKLRYKTFMEKVRSGRSAIELKNLPVTLDAATQHFFRSYYQIQQWLNREAINPLEWGWRVLNEAMWPVGMVKDPAPEELLELIRCKCRSDCSTKRCSCRAHGLECSVSCSDCNGVSCLNHKTVDVDNGVDTDDMDQ